MKDNAIRSLYEDSGEKLESIPFESRTLDLCLYAIRRNTDEFRYTPDSLKTPKICLAAVQRYGYLLEYVPVHLRTKAVCIAAVREDGNGKLLSFVPEENKTYDFYMEIFTSQEYDKKANDILDVGQYLDFGRLLTAIKTGNGDPDSYILSHIRDEWKTPELCMAAVKFDGVQLRFVPDNLRTKELCYAAVESNYYALDFVPESEKAPNCI